MSIEISGVSKSFGSKLVLNNCSITLPDSGTIALMGPSGCGKTTLLRILAGLETPDTGSIACPPSQRLSMVFQEDRLLEVLTARENILAVLPPERHTVADRWLADLGLADAANQYPSQMSGGMRRRLAIARAMAYDGTLLVLDEPFQGLDDATKATVMRHVFAPAPHRLTIWVTHDKTEVAQTDAQLLLLDGPPLRLIGPNPTNY